jgi:hypothetical protein
MSAIGTTEWFKETTEETREQNLVFELYPLQFVKEVREDLGSAAFFSSTPLGWEFQTVLRKFCGGPVYSGNLEELGSMLPFGWGAKNFAYPPRLLTSMAEHPSVSNWKIETSGMVRIAQVGLVSSSTGTYESSMKCILAAPSQESGWKYVEVQNTDLHKWCQQYNPQTPNWAVCLSHSAMATCGIVLKEIRSGVLIKVGWQSATKDQVA